MLRFDLVNHRNASGQGHSTVNFPVRNAGGRSARLSIYTDTPIQINSQTLILAAKAQRYITLYK
jgi:hypothetical protein